MIINCAQLINKRLPFQFRFVLHVFLASFWINANCAKASVAPDSMVYHGGLKIRNYLPEEYNANTQIWAVNSDQRGVMYFGQGGGIIEYDGINWRSHAVTNGSYVRSIAIDSTGIIYVGANNDFGYFKPSLSGELVYRSLNTLLPDSLKGYQDVWKTFLTPKGVYYISENVIFRWHDQQLKAFKVNLKSRYAFFVNGRIYVKDKNKGFSYIDKDRIVSLPNCDVLNKQTTRYFLATRFADNKILIVLNDAAQIFVYDTDLQELNTITANPVFKRYLNENWAYETLAMGDEMAFATLFGGIIMLNKTGEITKIINKPRGLSSDCVYCMHLDAFGDLWAGTQNGIARIDIDSPETEYGERQGIFGIVLDFETFKGTQYLTTMNDAYYLPPYQISIKDDNHPAQVVKNLRDCWDLFTVENHLLACHKYGLSEIKHDTAYSILQDTRTFSGLYVPERYPGLFFLAYANGVKVVRFNTDNPTNTIEITEVKALNSISEEARLMVFDKYGDLWVSTFNQGIIYVNFKESIDDYTVMHFDHRQGLPLQIAESTVERLNDRINIFTKKGIYKTVYPEPGQPDSLFRFEHDLYWGKMFTSDSVSIIRARQMGPHSFFLYGDKAGILQHYDDTVSFLSAPFYRLNTTSYVFNHVVEDAGLLKYGTTKAFYVYDLANQVDYTKPFEVRIRKVITTNDSAIYHGIFYDEKLGKVQGNQGLIHMPRVNYSSNDMRFEYAAIFYDESAKIQYQYRMEGFDTAWSKWTTESTAIYTNIPGGSYTFKVRAKNIYGTQSAVCTYQFVVRSPWYMTWYAYVAYLFLLLALVYVVTVLNIRRLKQHNLNLEHIVNERTIELEEQKEEILTQNDILHQQRKELEAAIEQLKQAQKQLVDSEKMASLGILTSGIAHEINNPLNFIHLGTHSIEDHLKEKDPKLVRELEPLFKAVYTGEHRILDIVRALGNYSRSDNLKLVAYDIHTVLEDCQTMLTNQLDVKIKIVKKLAPDIPKVLVNQVQIQHAFLNILKNAIQAIEETGQITISTKEVDGNVLISIADTGIGMSQMSIKHIFDPFYTTKDPGEGVGLGLSIARKTIEQHQGTIVCHSLLGEGTEMIVTLPVAGKNY